MSRWGEEEKKSKGLIGCFAALAILGVFVYGFYINYQNLEGRRNLEKEMQDIIRRGYRKDEAKMMGEIVSAAHELGIVLESKDISVIKSEDQNGNYVVDARIEFRFEVNLLVTDFEMNIPIVERVTLIL